MKSIKLSLAAALLVGSSVYALEMNDIKVSGDVNLFLATGDYSVSGTSEDSFLDQETSTADVSVNLNLAADLVKNDSITLSAGVGYTLLTTLGLENNFVSGVWGGSHTSDTGTGVENASYLTEAWLEGKSKNTSLKFGRMELDTPLAFTEKWTIEKNTFEAAVLTNTDLPSTTLVAAYIGKGNGTESHGGVALPAGIGFTGPVVNADGKFGTYAADGAYAFAAINNSIEGLALQAWYYDVSKVANATWFQADLEMSGIVAGAQYSGIDYDAAPSSDVYAVRLGYASDAVSANLNYSEVDKDGRAGFNTATATGTAQAALYTELWWNYGQVTTAGAKALVANIEVPTSFADLGLYMGSVDQVAANSDLKEVTASASKSFDFVDTSIAWTYAKFDGSTSSNTITVYLTANF